MMEVEITATRAAGLAGVVLGANLPDGQLDLPVLRRLVASAAGMGLVLHHSFVLTPDMAAALEEAVARGFRRILTSGGELTAEAGASRIAALVAQAKGRITIMPGSGVNPGNAQMLKGLGISEIHASCATSQPVAGRAVEMGFAPKVRRQTAAEQVRALRKALE